MFGGINPKQMEGMLKKMGVSYEEIKANKVIFETDEGDWIIEDPNIVKIKMNGQESYQITGEAYFQQISKGFNEEDIKMIIDKTGVDREIAIEYLQKNEGDIAATIIDLKKKYE